MATVRKVWSLLTGSLKEPVLSALWHRLLKRLPNQILAP